MDDDRYVRGRAFGAHEHSHDIVIAHVDLTMSATALVVGVPETTVRRLPPLPTVTGDATDAAVRLECRGFSVKSFAHGLTVAGFAEEAVALPVLCAIPSSRDVPLSLNLGTPVVRSNPRSPVARQLQQLAAHYAPVVKARKGWRR